MQRLKYGPGRPQYGQNRPKLCHVLYIIFNVHVVLINVLQLAYRQFTRVTFIKNLKNKFFCMLILVQW